MLVCVDRVGLAVEDDDNDQYGTPHVMVGLVEVDEVVL